MQPDAAPWRVNDHEHDAPNAPADDAAPRRSDYSDDAAGGTTWGRHAEHNGSEHIIDMADCETCGRAVMFYGRADNKPARALCSRCR